VPPNPEDCNVFPSLFGGADDDCYTEQPMPQVQELIKQVLYEKISSVGSRVIMDALIATGNEALVNAILAKSLTQQQAELLKQVSLDPQVAAALEQVKGRLLEGVEASVASVQENVLPKVNNAIATVADGVMQVGNDVIADIPFVGDGMAILKTIDTTAESLANAVDIKEEFDKATAPVTNVMKNMGELETALNTAANAASNAAAGASNAAAGAVAGTVGGVTDAVGGVTDAVADLSDQASSTVSNAKPDPNATQDLGKNKGGNQGGGSRTRRRIHKLSRRIERTLRRVQKKYGLQDKNSFLRRTLKRK